MFHNYWGKRAITIANRIKELRKKRKLTLKQLSDKTGISISSLSAYEKQKGEKGYRSPKIDKWRKLANALDVTVPYLQGTSSSDILKNKKFFESLKEAVNDLPKKEKVSKDNEQMLYEAEIFWNFLTSVGQRDDIPEILSNIDFVSEYIASIWLLVASMSYEIEGGLELSDYVTQHAAEFSKSEFENLTPKGLIDLPGDLELLSLKFLKNGDEIKEKIQAAQKIVKKWRSEEI